MNKLLTLKSLAEMSQTPELKREQTDPLQPDLVKQILCVWCTHREMYEGYSQQHRQEDGHPDRHHHNVSRQVCIVAKQQLRFHMTYKKRTSKCRRRRSGNLMTCGPSSLP